MNPSGLVKVAVCCAQKLPKMFDLDQVLPAPACLAGAFRCFLVVGPRRLAKPFALSSSPPLLALSEGARF